MEKDLQNSLMIRAAVVFAQQAHEGQKYGDGPYTNHLQDVAQVLYEFGCEDEHMLAAAFLHDTVEDTGATLDQIKLMFGDRVADLVYRVTNEEGANRKERHKKTYPKIKASEDAVMLKLADRIANTQRSIEQKSDLLTMYKKEYKGFREALYTPGVHEDMWSLLDALLG